MCHEYRWDYANYERTQIDCKQSSPLLSAFFFKKSNKKKSKRKWIFKVVENVVHLEFVGCTLVELCEPRRWSFSECAAAMQLHLAKQVCKVTFPKYRKYVCYQSYLEDINIMAIKVILIMELNFATIKQLLTLTKERLRDVWNIFPLLFDAEESINTSTSNKSSILCAKNVFWPFLDSKSYISF